MLNANAEWKDRISIRHLCLMPEQHAVPFHFMPSPTIHAPWRMEYIRSLEKPEGDACFICAAAAATTAQERKERFVLWSSEHCIIIINRYPYTNGHLLVASRAHKADLEQLSPEELLDLQVQTAEALKLLKRALSPQGFNIGINLGRCAGAGLPGHLHQHIVPRWGGDTNFMSVVGEVRIVPQAMSQLYDELMRVREEWGKS
jgi:ATP adenylyltransferase